MELTQKQREDIEEIVGGLKAPRTSSAANWDLRRCAREWTLDLNHFLGAWKVTDCRANS